MKNHITLRCPGWSYGEGVLQAYALSIPVKYRGLLSKYAAFDTDCGWTSMIGDGSIWLQLPGVVRL